VWELVSSDGWQRITWYPKQIVYRSEPLLLVELRHSGEFWDPGALADAEEYISVPQVECTLPNILLSLSKISLLDTSLAAWLDHRAHFDIVLSPNTYQSLSFQLGPSEQLISTRDKPACTLAYAAARLRSEWVMPVDQSCIRGFRQTIQLWRKSSASIP
jgi:hypothetical protein